MKNWMVWLVISGLVLGGGAALLAKKQTSKSEQVAAPEIVKAKLKVTSGKALVNGKQVTGEIEIVKGDKIVAEGKSEIEHANGTVSALDNKTTVVYEGYKIKIEAGNVWSRVVGLLGGQTYQTESPSVVATVRGTKYGHYITPKGDKIITTESTVLGECVNDTQKADVEEGKKGEFNCQEDEDAKVSNIGNADKDEFFKENNEEEVLGEATQVEEVKQAPQANLIDCKGADGKTTRVSKETCDKVNKFWESHPPAANPPATAQAASSNSNPAPTPTPTPGLAITGTSVSYCSSASSCYLITRGVKVTGTGFSANSRVELKDNYGGTHTGNFQSATGTEVLTDFNYLPCSKVYDVKLYFTDKTDVASKSAAFDTLTDPYCSAL